VHGHAGKGVDAVDVGQVGCGQHAAGVDQEPRSEFGTRVQLYPPQVLVVVELGAEHLRVEPDFRPQAILVDTVLGVGLQFVPGRVGARPVRALLEGELIGERRNIHGDTGIRVPVPGAAGTVAGLDELIVTQAGLVQLDRGADTGEPRTDDQGVVVRHRCASVR
jgi:hypothetical protein